MPYNEEIEETFAKKKVQQKKVVKPEEKRLENGQKTLFGFFSGKKWYQFHNIIHRGRINFSFELVFMQPVF